MYNNDTFKHLLEYFKNFIYSTPIMSTVYKFHNCCTHFLASVNFVKFYKNKILRSIQFVKLSHILVIVLAASLHSILIFCGMANAQRAANVT